MASAWTRRPANAARALLSTKGKRGTGLGLAMVYGVMERHEGAIEVDSERGKGTTFRLIFPVREDALASVNGEDDGVAPKPLQILCIDDEPLLRDLLKEMLERDGHGVEVSDGGQSGIEAFRSATRRGRPFDVVITDLGMPYVDGRQVAKILKRESPGTPVVMLTGWGAFMKEDSSEPAQVDGLLSKPPRSKETARDPVPPADRPQRVKVTQIFNLLFRRFAIGWFRNSRDAGNFSASRIQFCDTAD